MTEQLALPPTLLGKVTAATRFDSITEAIPVSLPHPSYLYVSLFVVFDFAVVNTYTHLSGGTHGFVRNPFSVFLYLGIILATVGVRYMHSGHANAMARLREQEICDVTDATDYTLSLRTKLLLYGLGLVLFFGYQTFVIGIDRVVQNQGEAGIVFTLVLLPACYLPVAIDLVGEYATLHLLLPRWLGKQDVGLFFFDPRDMGGFQPIGKLLKNSYYLYTVGLLFYLAFYYGIWATPIDGQIPGPPGATEAAMFTALWLFGLATLSYSMYKIHRIMKSQREKRLRDIEAEIQDIIDNPHDITNAEIKNQERLDELEFLLGQIRATSEYPTTFTMWTQIGISVLLPQVLQLSVQTAL